MTRHLFFLALLAILTACKQNAPADTPAPEASTTSVDAPEQQSLLQHARAALTALKATTDRPKTIVTQRYGITETWTHRVNGPQDALQISYIEDGVNYQEEFMRDNGSLVYAREQHRGGSSPSTEWIWEIEYVVQDDEVIDQISLGHGRTEMDSFRGSDILTLHHGRMKQWDQLKKQKGGEDAIEIEDLQRKELIQRINGIAHKTSKLKSSMEQRSHSVEDYSTEGGKITAYNDNGKLRLLQVTLYGEMGQSTTQYHVDNGQLVLMDEVVSRYNRPMYMNTPDIESGDDEVYDPAKTQDFQHRFYFQNNEMIYWTGPDHEPRNVYSSRALTVATEVRAGYLQWSEEFYLNDAGAKE